MSYSSSDLGRRRRSPNAWRRCTSRRTCATARSWPKDTNQFLDSQLEEARRRLLEKEKKLENYKRQYARAAAESGPDQSAGDSERAAAAAGADRIDQPGSRPPARCSSGRSPTCRPRRPQRRPFRSRPRRRMQPARGTTAQQLEVAQARLRGLELQFTPEHPDVKAHEER